MTDEVNILSHAKQQFSNTKDLQEFTSRLDACSEYNFVSMERYTCTMALEGGVHPWHWRQSSLFMALQRPHAQFLADEEQVRASFSRHCSGIDRDPISGRYRGCEVRTLIGGFMMSLQTRADSTWDDVKPRGRALPPMTICQQMSEAAAAPDVVRVHALWHAHARLADDQITSKPCVCR